VKGAQSFLNWNTSHRRALVEKFMPLASILIDFGVTQILVDGSFVSSKSEPGDIDGCYCIRMEDFVKLVSKHPEFDMSLRQNGKPLMWVKHRIELFADFEQAAAFDRNGNGIPFPSFFRMTKDGQKKGALIVQLGGSNDKK
jgi:hypothetical protein